MAADIIPTSLTVLACLQIIDGRWFGVLQILALPLRVDLALGIEGNAMLDVRTVR